MFSILASVAMRFITEQNIAKVSFLLTMVVISVITFGVGAYFVVTKFELAQRELVRLETELIDQQKEELQIDVANFLVRIESLSRSLQEIPLDQLESTAAGNNGDASVAKLLQQKVIEELGWADDLASDNFFIYQLHDMSGGKNFATMLFNPARPDLVGQQLSTDFPDARGQDFRKIFMKDIRDRGESFVAYWYKKNPAEGSEEAEAGRKLAFFKLDPDWNWIVAKSVYLDSIDLFIEHKRAAQKQTILVDLVVLAVFFLCSVVLAFFLAYSFSIGIHDLLKKHHETEQQQDQEIESLSRTIEQQNKSDRLTGAYNRAHLNDELAKEQARSDRSLTPLSLIVFDVDYFRAINDRLGRSAGDSVLTELVAMIKDNIRRTDIFARWGSEEFAILAPGIDLEQGRIFAEKLRLLVEEYPFSIKEKVTCSFGVSFYSPSENSEDFVQRADAALQRAKKEGRNRCVALE